MKSLCVFCSSSEGKDNVYSQKAAELGGVVAQKGIDLVYGGASRGIMGVLGKSALDKNGKVYGVMPNFSIEIEKPLHGLTELIIVDSLGARIDKMIKMSDAFIIFPGGIGTLSEFSQVFTLASYGVHNKPIGILNVNGYYDGLLKFINNAVECGFVNEKRIKTVTIQIDPLLLIESIDEMISSYS